MTDFYKLLGNNEILLNIERLSDMSFVLFETGVNFGRVVSCRTSQKWKNKFISSGENIVDLLKLDSKYMDMFTRYYSCEHVPICICSELGVGLFSSVFLNSTGLYLYIHLHCPLHFGLRVINSDAFAGKLKLIAVEGNCGPMRAEDIVAYRLVANALYMLDGIHLWEEKHRLHSVRYSYYELARMIAEVSEFAGCRVSVVSNFDSSSDGYVICEDVKLLRCIMFVCMLVVREYSEDRYAHIEIGNFDGYAAITVKYSYISDVLPMINEYMYLENIAPITGIRFSYCATGGTDLLASSSSRQEHRPKKQICKKMDMNTQIAFASNPDMGIAWDLKAGSILKR